MPNIYIMAGPNGSGKSTAARYLIPDILNCAEFVNADDIARGLSVYQPKEVAFQAGRMMLARLDELADAGVDFAFETTLSSRTFAPWLKRRKAEGYTFRLQYFCVESADMAIDRVAARVDAGGHHVPSEDVRRRFERSRRNFIELYMPLANVWEFYDTTLTIPKRVAFGGCDLSTTVIIPSVWEKLIQRV